MVSPYFSEECRGIKEAMYNENGSPFVIEAVYAWLCDVFKVEISLKQLF